MFDLPPFLAHPLAAIPIAVCDYDNFTDEISQLTEKTGVMIPPDQSERGSRLTSETAAMQKIMEGGCHCGRCAFGWRDGMQLLDLCEKGFSSSHRAVRNSFSCSAVSTT
jgi:hypothetical protein